jgi:hypothetical protein
MENFQMKELLERVAAGQISVEQAMMQVKMAPFADIDIAKLDTHRGLRQGASEVIYGAGKSGEQIDRIARTLWQAGQKTILITRMNQEKADYLNDRNRKESEEAEKTMPGQNSQPLVLPFTYDATSRIGLIGEKLPPRREGYILVATGGTSDIPVAEEAALTAEILGNNVKRVYDVGVAGIHRTLAHLDDIMGARVIITIAGMEGALASVIGGLASCPVIAVPTSVGYGTAFGGVTALLSMLNSCASGVSVVNIDNGFGAGYLANLINNMEG